MGIVATGAIAVPFQLFSCETLSSLEVTGSGSRHVPTRRFTSIVWLGPVVCSRPPVLVVMNGASVELIVAVNIRITCVVVKPDSVAGFI